MPDKKQVTAKYIGYSSKGFHFKVDDREDILFNKCDRQFIVEYGLDNQASNNKVYTIEYWEIASANDPFGKATKIICDIKLKP